MRDGRRAGNDRTDRRLWSLRSLSATQLVRYFYLSALRRANRAGSGRAAHQTPYEYEAELCEQLLPAEPDLHAPTEAFVEGRYGQREFETEDIGPIRRSWRRLRAALRGLRLRRSARGISAEQEEQ